MITSLTIIACTFILTMFNQADTLVYHSNLLASVMVLAITTAFFFDINRNAQIKQVSLQIIVAFLLRLFLVYFDTYGRSIFVLPNSGGDSDIFIRNSIVVALGGDTLRGTFCYVVGYLFKVMGVSVLYVQFLLMLCSIVSLYLATLIMNKCNVQYDTQKRVMWILALLPNSAILSSIFLRESLVTMLISFSIYFFVSWFLDGGEIKFVFSLVFIVIAMIFHSGTVAVAVGYIGTRLLYNTKTKSFRFSFANLLLVSALIVLFVVLFNNYGEYFFQKMSGVSSLEDIANTYDMGGSSYASYVGNSNNPLNVIVFTIPRMFYFIFSPLPWNWRSISDIIAFTFSSMFYLIVLVDTFRYIRLSNSERKKIVISLLIVALCTMFVFGWGVTNAGTATRHRDKMVILYGILLGLVRDGDWRFDRRNNGIRNSTSL